MLKFRNIKVLKASEKYVDFRLGVIKLDKAGTFFELLAIKSLTWARFLKLVLIS